MEIDEFSDLVLIDQFLNRWGIPIQTDHHSRSSVFSRHRVYISLVLVMINLMRYLIFTSTKNGIINMALSNQLRYYEKANFFFALIATFVLGSGVVNKLLMMKYQHNQRVSMWTQIFRDSSSIPNSESARERVTKWCTKNFKRCHRSFWILSLYYGMWTIITHLIYNDIHYALTIDLLWSFLFAFGVFFTLAQFFVGVILAILVFFYCNKCLDELSADLNTKRAENSSGFQRIGSSIEVMNILQRYNQLLSFIDACNDYWKNTIGVLVLCTISGFGTISLAATRVDRGTKITAVLVLLALALDFFPFFFIGNSQIRKVYLFEFILPQIK